MVNNTGKIAYHQQVSYCGKPRCKRCREGVGHGPYWYAYQTINGRTSRSYVGKHLPPDVAASMLGDQPSSATQASERDKSVLRIYTLGQFRLERRNPYDALEWQTVTDASWQHQRVRALLGCLVSVNGRKLGREQIMDALWPDLDMNSAGGRLDRAVYSLRQVFEPNRSRPATSPLLLTEREVLSLASSNQIWVDADAFENLIVQVHETKQAEVDLGTKEQLLKEAANLYAGEFLPEDSLNEWTRTRRESLKRNWIGLLLELADIMIDRDALTGAIEPLDKLISADPTNEAGVQRLMIVLEKLGRRGEALRSYKKLSNVLREEYNIAPLPETRKLYDDLRRGRDKTPTRAQREIVPSESVVREGGAGAATGGNERAALQIGRTHQSPLVGRQQELEQLKELVTTAEQTARFRLGSQRRSTVATLDPNRRPQCILLMGDVGIGKTRLAEELGRDAKKHGWAVAWSRVYAQEGTIPYRLWTEILRKAMEQGIWQRQEVKRRPLVFQSLGTLLPEIHDLLPPVSFPTSLSPDQEQLRLWEAARELLTLISESTPLLIVLDDLQWADSSSCELLAYLARRTYGYPIVIVGTCRENELAQDHALRPLLTDLRRENAVEVISLEPLSHDHIISLVSQVSPVLQAPETLVEKITTRAAGNPFFAEELARTVFDSLPSLDVLPKGGHDILPDTINAVLELRLNRLSEKCQRLLGKAAVLGGSFEFQVISEMEATSPQYDEDEVLELLEEALTSGMLTEEGTGTRITYHFWHPLLAAYLYDRLSAARRASQHRRAADVFRKMHKDREGEEAATITFHLVKGGANDQLIAQYAELAGNHASLLSSYRAARENYRIALEHLGLQNENWSRVSYLLERLGECSRIAGDFEVARQFFESALEIHLSHVVSDTNKQVVEVHAMLLWEIGATWYNQGDLSRSKECLEGAAQILRDHNIVSGIVWAKIRWQQSYIFWREGNYEKVKDTANAALKLLLGISDDQDQKVNDDPYLSLTKRALTASAVDIIKVYTLLSNVDGSSGHCKDALLYLNKALAIAEQHNSQRDIAIISCNMGDLYLRMADYSQAQAAFRRSYRLAKEIDEALAELLNLFNIGVVDIRTGNLADAANEIKRAIDLAKTTKDKSVISFFNAYLALAFLEQGKIIEAKEALYSSLNSGRKTHVSIYIGVSLMTLGYLRFIQSKDKHTSSDEHERLKLLGSAKRTLTYAIDYKGIEKETSIDGRIILAYVLIQLADIEGAHLQAEQALEEAKKYDLEWLIARANHVLGIIVLAKGLYAQAIDYYEKAESITLTKGMKLEYARIIYNHGLALLKNNLDVEGRSKGRNYIKDAQKLFEDCNARVDLKEIELEILKTN